MALGETMERILPLIFMEAVDLMDFTAAGTILGVMPDSTDLIGDGEIPIGDGVSEDGATDGDMVDSITHGTVHTTEDFMAFTTVLIMATDMDMRPIIIEVEEIPAMPLDDLVTITIDPVFPAEVVILDQKLDADQAEPEPPIVTAM